MNESDWRQRRRAARALDPEATARLLEEMGVEDRDDAEIEADERASRLAAMREYQPGAALQPELVLRLTGPNTERGALRFQWGDALLAQVEKAVSQAAGTPVELELTGVSSGSTVVHARPVYTAVPDPQAFEGSVATAADTGVQELTLLLATLEAGGDVRQWANMFDSVDALTKALERFELNLGLTWYAANGGMRQAQLTRRGMDYARQLRTTRDQDHEMPLSGRVTELKASGVVKVKTGTTQNAPAYEVRFDPDQLVRMRLALGDNVHFRVRFRQKLDAVGRAQATEYTFLGMAAEQPTLDQGA